VAKAVADAADVLNVVNTGNAQILDARSKVRLFIFFLNVASCT